MSHNNNVDLKRGFKEYDAKIKNLESIFRKLETIFDISNYIIELNAVKEDVNANKKLDNVMLTETFTLEYQSMVLSPYIKRLDLLTEKIEADLLPFYELHLLSEKINYELKEINADNIAEIIQYTKNLVDKLNSLNTHNNKIKNEIIEKTYQTIYSVILYEELFEISDILSYINYLNIPANIENIGKLLQNDVRLLSKKELIDEDLRVLNEEGLGYDYLNQDFITKISRNTVGNSNSEYLERKKMAISEISKKIEEFTTEKEMLNNILNSNKKSIKNLSINMVLLSTKVLAMVLVPIITIGAGNVIGKSMSNKITEYKTITRTIDYETKKIIGEPQEIYDEKETTYVATVMVNSPWRKNSTGNGYIRDVSAYEYVAPDNITEAYNITQDDLENNLLEKYNYIEMKEVLEDTDSTIDTTILITETYQDKNFTQKSTKYIIPFTIGGIILGIIIDTLLVLTGIYDHYTIERELRKLKNDIEKYKLNNDEIINRLNNMKENALLLENEYKDTVKKYGSWEEKFDIVEEKFIHEPTKKRKKYVKK